jgi:hypothetical protein
MEDLKKGEDERSESLSAKASGDFRMQMAAMLIGEARQGFTKTFLSLDF